MNKFNILPEMYMYQPGEPIDVVYTWVRNDAEQSEAIRRWKGQVKAAPQFQEDAAGEQRFRDMDELRHSLRSLEKFAPWVRKIFIVTNGQVPEGIDFSNPRIQLVTHAEIFSDPANLPTFNATAIETALHRVPGLARWYWYFNNDIFLGRPIGLDDLFEPDGRQKLALSQPVKEKWRDKTLFSIQSRKAVDFVNSNFGCNLPAYTVLHAAQLYNRDFTYTVEHSLPEVYATTQKARFRSEETIHTHSLLNYLLLIHARPTLQTWPYRSRYAEYIPLRDKNILRDLALMARAVFNLARNRPQFICFNDEMSDSPSWRTALPQVMLRVFYRLYFPTPCSLEVR